MTDECALVSVEDSDVSAVETALCEWLGMPVEGTGALVCGLRVFVSDLADAIAGASAFPRERGMEESDPFLRQYDMSRFVTEVSVCATSSDLGRMIYPVFGDALGRELSRMLRRKVLVRLGNGSVPFRLYEAGGVAQEWPSFYDLFFANRIWRPNSPAQPR